MSAITHLEASDYGITRSMAAKGDRRICAVFSTIGDREADLIHDKILLLSKSLTGFIDRIIVSHRRIDPLVPDQTEQRAREAWDRTEVILCHDVKVPDMGEEKGKGADMRRALYHIRRSGEETGDPGAMVVVFLDADVTPEHFGPHFVLGLAGPVLEGYDFAKAGFHRAMGRVKKFVAQPLFSSVRHKKLDLLSGFSYPLSGEVAGTMDFFTGVPFWQIYGIETGIDIDACMGDWRIADVNLGLYDHEHSDDSAIQRMAFGVIRTWLIQLADHGILELKDGASISDVFAASFIDQKGNRGSMEHLLREIKYRPLDEITGKKA